MNILKRIAAAALVLCMVLSLCACGSSNDSAETTGAAPVVTEAVTEAVKETKAPEETEAAQDGYQVTVVDEAGNPIAGAMVQLCMDTCFPGMTNESGVAAFNVEEADYKVSFLVLPAGYTYSTEEQEFHFANGSKEMTITLKAEG